MHILVATAHIAPPATIYIEVSTAHIEEASSLIKDLIVDIEVVTAHMAPAKPTRFLQSTP